MLSHSRWHYDEGRGRGVTKQNRRPHEPPDPDTPFRSTGDYVDGAFRCARCGYGVALSRALPRCPMCGGQDWEDELASAAGRRRARL
jgi:rubrerythrin